MIDVTVAWDKLSNFETADEIAQFFMDQGIKAVMNSSTSCAISKWMQDVTGDLSLVTTPTTIANFNSTRDGYGFLSAIGRHTVAIKDFIQKFDHGHYLKLVETWSIKESK